MNEDDARDAAWDKLMNSCIGAWFDNLPDDDAAYVRLVFDFSRAEARLHEAKEMAKFVDSITLIGKEV